MRVLAITSLHPNPFQPTLGVFNQQWLAALATMHAVTLISPIPWMIELRARLRGAPGLSRDRRSDRGGVAIVHPRHLFLPPKLLRRFHSGCFRCAVSGAFAEACRDFRPDVVLAAWAYPDGGAAVELARRASLPVVVKVLGSDVLCVAKDSRRWHRTRQTLINADGVVAVSQHLADRVIAMGVPPEKVQLVYSGVDAALFSPGPQSVARETLGLDPDLTTLLFVGNLFPVKGPDVLVDACAILKREGVSFRCYLVGDGPMRPSLERQVAAAGLAGTVKLLGVKPHHELPAWFRAADILVLPSHSEGVPNVLLESSASGTPFVASHVGGVPEVARCTGSRLVPPGDAAALARSIREALTARSTVPRRVSAVPRSLVDAASELAIFLDLVRRGPPVSA
jgi:glycosyltransferase involved in cell wall biosynthesis